MALLTGKEFAASKIFNFSAKWCESSDVLTGERDADDGAILPAGR